MMSLIHRALRQPVTLARNLFDCLPTETQTHARAATRESWLALRALADGTTDATERAIDRISRIIGGQQATGSGQHEGERDT